MRTHNSPKLIGQAVILLAFLFALIYGLALLEDVATTLRQEVDSTVQDVIGFRQLITNPERRGDNL